MRAPRSLGRRRFAPFLWLLPMLLGMASFGTCGPQTYPVTIDVPPRKAPVGIRQLAVLDFTPPVWGGAVARGVRGRLAEEGYIEPVTAGHSMVLHGTVSAEPVRTTVESHVSTIEVKENGVKQQRQVVHYTVRKQATVGVSYTLQDGARVLAGNHHGRSYDQMFRGNTPQEAHANAPSDGDIQGTLLAQLVDEIVFDVSPHKEVRQIPLEKGDHPGLQQGITYMQHNRFEQAFDVWETVIGQAQTPEDTAAAHYNIGAIREARGELREAFEAFSKADALVPANPTYLAAMSRVERRQAEVEALRGPAAVPDVAATPSDLRLTVRVVPAGARVKIMNITPAYEPGMLLPPGRYDVMVEAAGYAPYRNWVELANEDLTIEVQLRR